MNVITHTLAEQYIIYKCNLKYKSMTMCLRDPCYGYSKLHSVFNVVSKIVINMLKARKVRLMGEGWKWCIECGGESEAASRARVV